MNVLETKISWFKSTKQIEVAGEITIQELLEKISSQDYIKEITKLREGNKDVKTYLPTFAAHGLFKHYRKKDNFIEASGIIILDIDDVDEKEIEDTKVEIMDSSDHVLAVMTSPSGNGIKVLYYVDPEIVTKDSYREIGKELISNFNIYGDVDFLSITDCLIITSDPQLLVNEEAIPDRIYIKEKERLSGELEPIDQSKILWEDPEDFFDTVLHNDIAEKTNNNFHFIQVAVLDMKKFGFEHPKEDLSFIIDYAESNFKSSSSNKTRFLEVVEIAKDYPQLRWPYKLYLEEDIEDDEYIDYSEFQMPQNEDIDTDEEDEGYDGLPDYQDLFNKVLETIKEGDRVGYEISLKNFADILRFKGSGILTATGIPGSGKTEYIDQIFLDLARLHDQQSLIAGYEQKISEHIVKLLRKMIGKDIRCETYRDNPENEPTITKNYNFIVDHFKHIEVDKIGGNINDILKYAADIIKREREKGNNPKYICLDPFNMLSIKGRFSNHEKAEEILRRITHFSHKMNVLVFLVAHPFKMKKDEKTGVYEIPDFYSVKGTSAFFEMSYHGFVVYRKPDGSVLVKILKVKQNNLGTTNAEAYFYYDKLSGRYIPIDEDGNELAGDHRDLDWLEKFEKEFKKIYSSTKKGTIFTKQE